MTLRRGLGLAAAVAYVGVLVYATAGAQCPVRPDSGCAKVHALMRTARPLDRLAFVPALPMRATRGSDVMRLAMMR